MTSPQWPEDQLHYGDVLHEKNDRSKEKHSTESGYVVSSGDFCLRCNCCMSALVPGSAIFCAVVLRLTRSSDTLCVFDGVILSNLAGVFRTHRNYDQTLVFWDEVIHLCANLRCLCRKFLYAARTYSYSLFRW